MTWFKVDDSLHSHPKVMAASLAAIGLWSVAGSWSSDHLTDGFIPDHMIPSLTRGQIELAKELITAGLWKRARGGYRFHQWAADGDGSVRNPTRDEAVAGRRRMSSGGALGNHRRWHMENGKSDPHCRYCQEERDPNGDRPPDRVPDDTPESAASPPVPYPSRTRSSPGGEPKESPPASPDPPRGSRGSRLPDDFTVTDEMRSWAREHAPLCGTTDHEAFCDYWCSVPGAKGRKIDWVKTWRNWMRREQERRTRQQPHVTQNRPMATGDRRAAEIEVLRAEMNGTRTPHLNVVRGELS